MGEDYIEFIDGVYKLKNVTYYKGFYIGVILETTEHLYNEVGGTDEEDHVKGGLL